MSPLYGRGKGRPDVGTTLDYYSLVVPLPVSVLSDGPSFPNSGRDRDTHLPYLR